MLIGDSKSPLTVSAWVNSVCVSRDGAFFVSMLMPHRKPNQNQNGAKFHKQRTQIHAESILCFKNRNYITFFQNWGQKCGHLLEKMPNYQNLSGSVRIRRTTNMKKKKKTEIKTKLKIFKRVYIVF